MNEQSGGKKVDQFLRDLYVRERENLVLVSLIYLEAVEIF